MGDLFGVEEVRALSWKQPYGLLMLKPYNKIETRTWRTGYRGKVLMCASQVPYSPESILNISGDRQFTRAMELIADKDLQLGKAFAIGELIDCRRMTPADEDKTFVAYHPELWCHVYTAVHPIEPFDWKGGLGLRKLSPEDIAKIKFI